MRGLAESHGVRSARRGEPRVPVETRRLGGEDTGPRFEQAGADRARSCQVSRGLSDCLAVVPEVDVDLDEQGTDEKCDVGTSDRRQLAAGVLRLFEGKTE